MSLLVSTLERRPAPVAESTASVLSFANVRFGRPAATETAKCGSGSRQQRRRHHSASTFCWASRALPENRLANVEAAAAKELQGPSAPVSAVARRTQQVPNHPKWQRPRRAAPQRTQRPKGRRGVERCAKQGGGNPVGDSLQSHYYSARSCRSHKLGLSQVSPRSPVTGSYGLIATLVDSSK
jgi:hypothetical protein